MAAWRYEITLLFVLKTISTPEEKFASPRGHKQSSFLF